MDEDRESPFPVLHLYLKNSPTFLTRVPARSVHTGWTSSPVSIISCIPLETHLTSVLPILGQLKVSSLLGKGGSLLPLVAGGGGGTVQAYGGVPGQR